MKRITIKFFIICSIIIAVVLKIESTNAFNPISGTDLYTHARWNSLYDLTEKDTIDILIMDPGDLSHRGRKWPLLSS